MILGWKPMIQYSFVEDADRILTPEALHQLHRSLRRVDPGVHLRPAAEGAVRRFTPQRFVNKTVVFHPEVPESSEEFRRVVVSVPEPSSGRFRRVPVWFVALQP